MVAFFATIITVKNDHIRFCSGEFVQCNNQADSTLKRAATGFFCVKMKFFTYLFQILTSSSTRAAIMDQHALPLGTHDLRPADAQGIAVRETVQTKGRPCFEFMNLPNVTFGLSLVTISKRRGQAWRDYAREDAIAWIWPNL